MFSKWFAKKQDPLAAGTVPGTRSVNNVPLIIGGIVLMLFLAVMAYVMMQRSQNAEQAKADSAKSQGSSAARLAADVTGPWGPGGLVPSDQLDMPLPSEEPKDVVPNSSPKPQISQNLPPLPKERPPVFMTEEQGQIRNARIQALQAGLRAKTGVQTADSRPRPTAASSRSTLEQDSVRRQQSGLNDATAVYQARMGQLRGDSSASASIPSLTGNAEGGRSDNNLGKFNRGNRWDLQNKVEAPASPYVLRAGFVIPAIMLSGINSDLLGQVMAQVSQNVYDTASGKYLLVPQGTRLIGTYNSDIAYGQERILMAWQRLVFPDGKALDIEAMPGADSAGMAGFEDKTNNHYFRTFSSAFLLSGVIAAVSMSQNQSRNSDRFSNQQRASDSLSEALGQTLGSTMSEMLKKNLNIAPTLEIRPGFRFNVMVTKDMTFNSPFQAFDY